MDTLVNDNIDDNKLVDCFYGENVIRIPRKLFRAMASRLQIDNRKFVRYKEGAQIYDMCEREFNKLAHDANAVYKRNRLVLVNIEIIDKYLEIYRK